MLKYLKKLSAVFLILVMVAGLSACNNTQVKQLRDQTIVLGIGIDMKKKGFEITFQVMDISKAGVTASDSKGNITTTYTSEGDTISTAVANGQKVLDRETFLSQNKVIVMAQEVAEKHLDQVLDYFIRSKTCRPDVQMAVTEDSAKEIMESKCKNAIIPAEKIQKTLINGEYNGKSVNKMVMNVVNDYLNPMSGVYLPKVKLFEKGENVMLDGIALFPEEGSPGHLNDRESRGVLWANNKIRNGAIVVNLEKVGKVTLRIVRSRSKASVSLKDNRIWYHLDVSCFVNVNEMENGIKTSISEKDLKEIQKKAQSVIRSEVEDALEKCLKEYRCDSVRIGRLLGQREYQYYKKIKDSYTDELPFVQYDISPQVHVKRLDNEAL